MVAEKLFATSVERYNGGARIKRAYGSSTVTRFMVGVKGSPPETWLKVEGYGATPGDRKSFAIAQFEKTRAPKTEPAKVSPWPSAEPAAPKVEEQWTPRQRALYAMAKQAMDRGDEHLHSFSGADKADSEKFFLEAQVYRDVAAGIPFEDAFRTADARWRKYAKEQQQKVAEAPKIQRGPMSGQSAIHYKWVSEDAFSGMQSHVRFMVNRADEDAKAFGPKVESFASQLVANR
jgi:hypothetical protein